MGLALTRRITCSATRTVSRRWRRHPVDPNLDGQSGRVSSDWWEPLSLELATAAQSELALVPLGRTVLVTWEHNT